MNAPITRAIYWLARRPLLTVHRRARLQGWCRSRLSRGNGWTVTIYPGGDSYSYPPDHPLGPDPSKRVRW